MVTIDIKPIATFKMKYVADGSATTLSNEELKALEGFDLERALTDSDVINEYRKLIPSYLKRFQDKTGFKTLHHEKQLPWSKRMALMAMIQKSHDAKNIVMAKYGDALEKKKKPMEIIDCCIGKLPKGVTKEEYENFGMPKHMRTTNSSKSERSLISEWN